VNCEGDLTKIWGHWLTYLVPTITLIMGAMLNHWLSKSRDSRRDKGELRARKAGVIHRFRGVSALFHVYAFKVSEALFLMRLSEKIAKLLGATHSHIEDRKNDVLKFQLDHKEYQKEFIDYSAKINEWLGEYQELFGLDKIYDEVNSFLGPSIPMKLEVPDQEADWLSSHESDLRSRLENMHKEKCEFPIKKIEQILTERLSGVE